LTKKPTKDYLLLLLLPLKRNRKRNLFSLISMYKLKTNATRKKERKKKKREKKKE